MKIFLHRLRHPLFQLVSLILLSIALYAHSLDVPFYLDDYSSLVENPVIYMQQGAAAVWQYSPLRFLPYMTFSWNYALHQFSPAGYHVVSIFLHALTGLAVWWLVRVLLQTPRLKKHIAVAEQAWLMVWLPWLTALLFIAHPLQTQAVSYIVQRPTLFAALFYLLAIAGYVQGRLASSAKPRLLWFALSAILALAGFFSKQNAATLPAALLLVEILLIQFSWRRFIIGVALMAGGVALLWLAAALSFGFNPLALDTVLALTRETDSIPRLQYFLTQVNVLWQYLGLLWWPLDLHLDRHVVPVTGFNSVTILALAAHIALITFAIWAGRRWPLLSFGILFYYLAHIVESSFLPIKDLMFEHRTYLPNVGAFLLLAWGFLALAAAIARASARGELDKCPGGARSVRRGWLAFGVVAFVTLAVLSWQRNQMWRDAVSFWNHNAQLTPQKDRPWGILGKQLIRAGRYEDALRALQYAIALKQNQTGSLNPLDLINLVVALRQLGRDDEALAIIDQVLRNPLPALLRSKLLINKGNIYYVRKQTDTAQKLYSQALQANPDSLEARANLGNVMMVQGKLAQAEQLYRQILEIDPDNSQYRENYTMIRQALDKQK